jgi:hypothetical protein
MFAIGRTGSTHHPARDTTSDTEAVQHTEHDPPEHGVRAEFRRGLVVLPLTQDCIPSPFAGCALVTV